jgi:hypothetical protein
MLKNFIMNGEWKKITITLWIDKEKSQDVDKRNVNDWFGQLRKSICLACAPENSDYIYLSEFPNPSDEDQIRLWPSGDTEFEFSDVATLNNLYALGVPWDVLFVFSR